METRWGVWESIAHSIISPGDAMSGCRIAAGMLRRSHSCSSSPRASSTGPRSSAFHRSRDACQMATVFAVGRVDDCGGEGGLDNHKRMPREGKWFSFGTAERQAHPKRDA